MGPLSGRVTTPITIASDALDFTQLIRFGETVGWAEATVEPVFLTRLLDTRAQRCPPFRVFFPLTFSDGFAADHPNVTVTALGGASAGRRFFADGADNVIPANISDISGFVSSGRLPIDVVLLQVSGPDETGQYNAGLGIEHLHAAIGRARLVITQVNPELPWTQRRIRAAHRNPLSQQRHLEPAAAVDWTVCENPVETLQKLEFLRKFRSRPVIEAAVDSPASGAIIARLSEIGRWRAARQEKRARPAAGRSCAADRQ